MANARGFLSINRCKTLSLRFKQARKENTIKHSPKHLVYFFTSSKLFIFIMLHKYNFIRKGYQISTVIPVIAMQVQSKRHLGHI